MKKDYLKKEFKISTENQILIDVISKEHYSGHFTVFSFTTEYKFCFGTITEREEIENLLGFDNINDAIFNEIQLHFSRIKEDNNG